AVRRNRDPAGGMNALHGLGQRAERRDALLHEQRQQVPAAGGDLLAYGKIEVIVARCMELTRAQGAVDALVVGDRDQIEVGPALDPLEDLRRSEEHTSELQSLAYL